MKHPFTDNKRFFIHKEIQAFAADIVEKYGREGEGAMLFPTHITASRCRDFILRVAADQDTSQVRIVDLVPLAEKARAEEMNAISPRISAVIYPLDLFKVARPNPRSSPAC